MRASEVAIAQEGAGYRVTARVGELEGVQFYGLEEIEILAERLKAKRAE